MRSSSLICCVSGNFCACPETSVRVCLLRVRVPESFGKSFGLTPFRNSLRISFLNSFGYSKLRLTNNVNNK